MRRFPWHALLVPLVPVASMYSQMAGNVRADGLIGSALVVLAAAAVLLAVAWAFYRDAQKAALFISVALIVFLGFDRVYAAVENLQVAGFRPTRRMVVIPATYLLLAVCAWRIYRLRRPLDGFTALANVVVVGCLILPAASIARSMMSAVRQETAMLAIPPAESRAAARPSIYYVVFDRYGDEETTRLHGLDNAPFYRYLSEQGFYVAGESRSNYVKTILSLASSLNMSYLDPLVSVQGAESENWRPIYDWVQNGSVVRFLKSQGYRYVHVGSWFSPTAASKAADRNVNAYTAVPRPVMLLLDTELMRPIRRIAGTPLLDARLQQWHRVRWQVDEVVRIASDSRPTFTFVHILVPHNPFVFDADGSYVTADQEGRRSTSQNYINQVQAANLFARRLVDGILARAPSPPVIILQGDEGPYPLGISTLEYNWRNASPTQLREKSGILNAFYLPGRDAAIAGLYPSISPVNTFRVLFNSYLGTRLDTLPDRVISHESERRPYAMFDITDAVRTPLSTSAAALAAVEPSPAVPTSPRN